MELSGFGCSKLLEREAGGKREKRQNALEGLLSGPAEHCLSRQWGAGEMAGGPPAPERRRLSGGARRCHLFG